MTSRSQDGLSKSRSCLPRRSSRNVESDATTWWCVFQKSLRSESASVTYRAERMSNIVLSRYCHCSTNDAGHTISNRRTSPLDSKGHRIKPASIVLPSPTSSATSQRAGHPERTRRHTQSWWGSSAIRDREKTPHVSFTDTIAEASALHHR